MSSLKRDTGAGRDVDLTALVAAFEAASYRNDYYTTFMTFLDYAIAEFTAGDPYTFNTTFSAKEQAQFPLMLQSAITYTRKRANLWTRDRLATGWADPFGALFEAVAGNFKKSAQGLFFTPEPVCSMIAQMVVRPGTVGETALEPACGSGRMILAAGAINPGIYACANDIDPACTKMTAVNMALNGIVGEATCMDALWPGEDRYRFGYRIVPVRALLDNGDPFTLLIMARLTAETGGADWLRQYLLLPLPYAEARIAVQPADVDAAAPVAAIIEGCAQARADADTPTLQSLFEQALPKGTQGQLF